MPAVRLASPPAFARDRAKPGIRQTIPRRKPGERSARYGRLIAVPTAELAGEVQDFAVKANDVFPSDQQKLTLRREYLLRCHAAAKALGERMDKVHEVLRSNPEGAFRNGKGVTLSAEAALKKLHRMETDVGADCVALRKKLEAVADSDKRRYMAQEKKRKS